MSQRSPKMIVFVSSIFGGVNRFQVITQKNGFDALIKAGLQFIHEEKLLDISRETTVSY